MEANLLDQLEQALHDLVQGNTQFAVNLYRQLAGSPDNLFFSPCNLSCALAMVYAGASAETAEQMAEVLGFHLPTEQLHPAFGALKRYVNLLGRGSMHLEDSVRLYIANALWPQKDYPYMDPFLAILREHYGGEIHAVDFVWGAETARKTINAWVNHNTYGKISEIIPEGALNQLTRLVVTSAIYFKSAWQFPFDAYLTENKPFWLATGEAVNVPTMQNTSAYRFAQLDDLQAIELPYQGNQLSMLILLPGRIEGLAELEQGLSPVFLDDLDSALISQNICVELPRLSLSSDLKLNKLLQRMGMVAAFDPDLADFSAMNGRAHWLYIDAVFHKTWMLLNEQGSEAAAASGVVINARSLPEAKIPEILINHPFLFIIREKNTAATLFMGRVLNPGI